MPIVRVYNCGFSIHKRIEGGATAVFCPFFYRFFAFRANSGGSAALFLFLIINPILPFSQIVFCPKNGEFCENYTAGDTSLQKRRNSHTAH